MAWIRHDAWAAGSLVIAVIVGACKGGDDGETGAGESSGEVASEGFTACGCV
jgi:hypothetical protein